MRALLAFAAIAVSLPTAPALAEHGTRTVFVSGSGGAFIGDGRHHRRHRGFGDAILIDRDYQGDTAWKSDSFNDWWHDQPSRSFPRWMQNNERCERQWWGGDALRC